MSTKQFNHTIRAFLRELDLFDYDLLVSDFVWNLIFSDNKNKWYHLQITKYQQTFYVSHIDGNSCALEAGLKKNVQVMKSSSCFSSDEGCDNPSKVWEPIILSARGWLKKVKKDWVAANKHIMKSYPLNRRFGVVPNSLIRASLTDIYRLDHELGKTKSKKFINLVEAGYFNKEHNTTIESMTVNDYFNYCKLAYIAGRRKGDFVDKNLSGRQMYERYADGRHNGLLDIDPNSKQEFSDWIDGKHPKKTSGGHPWEIKRGGNTTHIDLSVFRSSFCKENGFKIELRGASINRLKEAIQMFLAIHKESLPISIADPEGIRKRLLGHDNIGIVPSYIPLHRASKHFSENQNVYDVLHYDDIGRYKRRLAPFIMWKPLPILKPRNIAV